MEAIYKIKAFCTKILSAIPVVFVALPTMKVMSSLFIAWQYFIWRNRFYPESIEDGLHYNLHGSFNSTFTEEDDLHEAFDSLAEAYYGLQRQFEERLSSLSSMSERQSNLSEEYKKEIDGLNLLVHISLTKISQSSFVIKASL